MMKWEQKKQKQFKQLYYFVFRANCQVFIVSLTFFLHSVHQVCFSFPPNLVLLRPIFNKHYPKLPNNCPHLMEKNFLVFTRGGGAIIWNHVS